MRRLLRLNAVQERDLSTGEYWLHKLGCWLIGLGGGASLALGPRNIGSVAIPMLVAGVALMALVEIGMRRKKSD